jgi:integrase
MWHVRFYVDVPGQDRRRRKSVPVGPATGKEKLTRPEALRRGAEIVESSGVNTAGHLERALHPETLQTLGQRVEWCRRYHKAWTDSKPGTQVYMESLLSNHILPRLGDTPLTNLDETRVQEFVADLKRQTFERRKPNGDLIKTYRLSRKTILNIVGVLKLIVGRKAWLAWSLDLGKAGRPKQRYFNDEQLRAILSATGARYRVLFALLLGTGIRIGEAAGLYIDDVDLKNGVIHIRRAVWRGIEQTPKSDAGFREIDIDQALVELLREHIGDRKAGRLFETRTGKPINGNNIRNRILQPLLVKLGIPKAGMHAFRHSRVTVLRKNGTPEDLQRLWIGHSSLRTTDRYSHTDQEIEYRRNAAAKVGLEKIIDGPKGPNKTHEAA